MKSKETVTIKDMSGVKVVHILGHLDLETAAQVKPKLFELAKKPHCKIVLDLENTSYISSFGLSLLLRLNDEIKAVNGRLALAALHAFARQVFDTTQLGSVFKVYEDVETAVKALA
jgi:anti-sigma B factor antagonist